MHLKLLFHQGVICGNSAPRNHFLLKYLDNYRYIDGLGRGIPMIIKEMQNNVIFEEIGHRLRVILILGEDEGFYS